MDNGLVQWPRLASRVLKVGSVDHGCDRRLFEAGSVRRTVLAAGPVRTQLPRSHILYMIAEQTPVLDEEPMGIVISCGPEGDVTPAVFEYIWGPAPEDSQDAIESKVA